MLKMFSFDSKTLMETFAPLINNFVIDDALLEIIPDVVAIIRQRSYVMNFHLLYRIAPQMLYSRQLISGL